MTKKLVWKLLCVAICMGGLSGTADGQTVSSPSLNELLSTIKSVGPGGKNNAQAAKAWRQLVTLDAGYVTTILEAIDTANPLAANWLLCAVDTICERELRQRGSLPTAELEKFVLDRRHNPKARRVAFEWLVLVEPTAKNRLLAGMLDDPSLELRRDAISLLVQKADQLASQGKAKEYLRLLRQAFDAARDRDQVEQLAQQLKEAGVQVDLARHYGYIQRWLIIGPFDNTEEKGFDTVYPPEQEFSVDAQYQGKLGPVSWQPYQTEDPYGLVDLNQIIGELKGVVAYARAEVIVDRPQKAEIRVQTYNALKVWHNGRLVGAFNIYHSGAEFDQYVCPIQLVPGKNVILLKVCQNEQTQPWARYWQFQARLCDPTGGGIVWQQSEQQ